MNSIFREAQINDIDAIFVVRVAVRENRLNYSQLRAIGITPESIAQDLSEDSKAWVCECDGKVVGFSMANSTDGRIFALFVLPDYEQKGIGKELLAMSVSWLRSKRVPKAWLTTDEDTRAAGFYRNVGWSTNGEIDHGEIRFELNLS